MRMAEDRKKASKGRKKGKESEARIEVKDVARDKTREATETGMPERDASGRFLPRNPAQSAKKQPAKTKDSQSTNGGNGKDGSGSGSGAGLITEAGQRRLVGKLLDRADQLAGSADCKLTGGDLIRLIQLQKEFTAKTPRKLTVQWVEDKSE